MSITPIQMSNAIATVTELVYPHYAKNDPGHTIKHAEEVCQLAVELAQYARYARYPNMDLVVYAAYLHDVQVYVDRENHHTLAGSFVRSGACDHLFDNTTTRELVAAAVEEHRASYTGRFTSALSEIISSADRMHPSMTIDDLYARIVRSIRHRYDTDEICAQKALQHLINKFGRNGYVRYPQLYRDYFHKELEQRYLAIEQFLKTHQY